MAKKTRYMRIVSTRGVRNVSVGSDKTSTRISLHWHAIDRYLKTGATDQLEQYEDQRFKGVEFETDITAIDELYAIGELDVPSIYASVEGA